MLLHSCDGGGGGGGEDYGDDGDDDDDDDGDDDDDDDAALVLSNTSAHWAHPPRLPVVASSLLLQGVQETEAVIRMRMIVVMLSMVVLNPVTE